jgi:hypothetical protein
MSTVLGAVAVLGVALAAPAAAHPSSRDRVTCESFTVPVAARIL